MTMLEAFVKERNEALFSLDRKKIEAYMIKYRETPCKFYICRGECSKGRTAEHKTYCQHCSKYYPRAKVRHINQKKRYNEQQRSQITA